MRIGVLTGGGDCSGLNAAIRAIVKYGTKCYGNEFVGIKYGWGGLVPEAMSKKERATLDPEELEHLEKRVIPLGPELVSGILTRGGTILGSSRANPANEKIVKDGMVLLKERFLKLQLDGLIAIGGEDTLGVAYKAFCELSLPVVGIPKTIDNDVFGTETTIGFTTAYGVITDAVDRIHSTAESHHTIHIIETMGRRAGWIAFRGGVAGGADIILIPELPLSINEILELIDRRRWLGKKFSIIVVAEGYQIPELEVASEDSEKDAFGHELLRKAKRLSIGRRLAAFLEEKTGLEVRVTEPNYMQRGGTPSPYDRYIATFLGMRAVDLVNHKQFGRIAVVSSNDEVIDIELREIVNGNRLVPATLFEKAKWLFG